MYEKLKNNYQVVITCVLIVIILAVGVCYLYDRNATADGSNAIRTVQQIKDDNQSARDDIDAARVEIRHSNEELDRAISGVDNALQSTSRIQESVRDNEREIGQSRTIITESRRNLAEAESIFRDVDAANQIHSTQNSGN